MMSRRQIRARRRIPTEATLWSAAMAALALLTIVAMLLGSRQACAQDHEDEVFLNGLRHRQLFSLAANYCRKELANQPPPRRAADLTEELIRTLAQYAAHEEPVQRKLLWEEVRKVAAALPADNPRYFLVQTQAALAELARAELGRQEAAVHADPNARDRVLEAVRDAQRLLEQLNKTLTAEIPARTRRPPTDKDALTADELFSLQNHLQFHLAAAFRTRARCYPPGADDRVAALYSAMEWSRLPLEKLSPDEPLVQSIHLEQAACQRLLGNVANAKKLLTPLLNSTIPSVQLGAIAEAARLELDQGKLQETYAALQPAPLGTHPEIDLVRLDASLLLLKDAKAKKDEAATKQARDNSVALTKTIRAKHGPYWGRRADQQLLEIAGKGNGGDLDILTRQADEFWQRGQLEKAIEAYDLAAAKASQAGDDAMAFELFYKAALVEGRRQDPGRQAERLRRVAVQLPNNPNASKAHYMAVLLTAQQARLDAALLDTYAEMLTEHLTRWPQSPHAGKLNKWQGRLAEQRGQWTAAMTAYQAAAALALDTECVQGYERSAIKWLEQVAAEDAPQLIPDAAKIASQLEQWVLENGRLPPHWMAAQRAAALSAARIHLRFVPSTHLRAESLLSGAINGAPPATAEFQKQAQPLLVVALAGQPAKLSAAENVLKQLGETSVEQLLETLDGLTEAMRSSPQESRAGAAKLQLDAIEAMLGQPNLDGTTKNRIERIRAEALAVSGDLREAMKAYESLAARHPKDGGVQIAYARFLSGLSSADAVEKALNQWRRVSSKARPASDLWYEAKYQIALQLFRMGDKAGAAERLNHVKVVNGLDNTRWKNAYLHLLNRCQ